MAVWRILPVWLGLVGGLAVVLGTFINSEILRKSSTAFLQWRVVMAAVALTLGGANMLRIHYRNIAMKRPRWIASIVLVASLSVMFVLGVTSGTRTPTYRFLFENMYSPVGATISSLNAFYISTACYRAFRAQNAQAVVLLVSGMVVVLGSVGMITAVWGGFPTISDWIMNVPNSAAMRAMGMSAALGMVGVSLRVILGLERGHLRGAE